MFGRGWYKGGGVGLGAREVVVVGWSLEGEEEFAREKVGGRPLEHRAGPVQTPPPPQFSHLQSCKPCGVHFVRFCAGVLRGRLGVTGEFFQLLQNKSWHLSR